MAAENDLAEANLDDEDIEDENDEEGGLDVRKLLLLVVAPLLILCGAGAGLYFTGTLDRFFGGAETEAEEHADAGGSSKKTGGKGGKHGGAGVYFVEIPNMIVNLSGSENQPRYLRLSVQIELESEEDQLGVETIMPRVVDQFQTYLRELRVSDLRGSTGLYRLRIELLTRLNAAAYPIEVKNVLFQEILIQ